MNESTGAALDSLRYYVTGWFNRVVNTWCGRGREGHMKEAEQQRERRREQWREQWREQREQWREQREQGTERDSEAAREALLAAAEEVFAECGFSGARVNDIAQAAGYNKALIFHYFGDKLGLYQGLVGRMKRRNTARITELLERFFPEGSEPRPEQVRVFLAEAI